MKIKKLFSTLILVIIISTLVTSCDLPFLAKPTPTPQPTATETASPTVTASPSPTATLTPTVTPIPTATLNATATAQYSNMYSLVKSLYDDGYVPSLNGTFRHLEDYSNQWAQLDWYQWSNVGWSTGDFVLKAHMAWVSDTETPNPSGCGVVFHQLPTYEHYVVFVLSLGYVEFAITTDRTRTQGWTYFGPSKNQGEADFHMTAVGSKFDVFINGKHIKTYTGYQGKMDFGELGFTTLSGTNAGFGTQCDITGADLWMIKK